MDLYLFAMRFDSMEELEDFAEANDLEPDEYAVLDFSLEKVVVQ